ncbi:15624_t:CDS:2 [Funneliformis caledonium]|uniref:15624_t:CDS:1 n=1 Tax=Funneliformis caledonium TaxID=1117310 RepID=A0A9N9FGX1_9GLOM|nr:15624_t:CDS:2 [Funneliformis caledonium]
MVLVEHTWNLRYLNFVVGLFHVRLIRLETNNAIRDVDVRSQAFLNFNEV